MRHLSPVLALAFLIPHNDSNRRTIKPVMVWTGIDSNQTKRSFSRCCTQKEWEADWRKHQGRDEKPGRGSGPEIDFVSYMAVTIFQGESFQNHGIEIVSITEEKDCIRVRYRELSYQIAFGSGGGSANHDTQSYAFVVIPRSQKELVLEEDVRRLIRAAPEWKQRARIPATGR